MAVDLVGSTTFKNRHGDAQDEGDFYPKWVKIWQRFYSLFPEIVKSNFERTYSSRSDAEEYRIHIPRIWKTVGDEIIFCVRVHSLSHLDCLLISFMEALSKYGDLLEQEGTQLDVKGYAWIAAFPIPNVTLSPANSNANSSLVPDEAFEVDADRTPSRFDFLGRQIDAGFRIARFARADSFAISVELAWLITKMTGRTSYEFYYAGSAPLKGVLNENPYPAILVDVSRRHSNLEVRRREAALTGSELLLGRLNDYVEAFLAHERIEHPSIGGLERDYRPKSYDSYKEEWIKNTQDTQFAQENEELDDDDSTGSDELPPEIEETLNRVAPDEGELNPASKT